MLAIARWTAPFAALSVGLVALGWLNERNPQRLVADPEESALGVRLFSPLWCSPL